MLAANWVGVMYLFILSAKLSFVAILELIGLISKFLAANWDGVT